MLSEYSVRCSEGIYRVSHLTCPNILRVAAVGSSCLVDLQSRVPMMMMTSATPVCVCVCVCVWALQSTVGC